MRRYLISMDGGGTKTEFCIKDMQKGALFFFKFGSSNYKSSSAEYVKRNIMGGFKECLKQLEVENDEIAYVVCGIAGLDSREDYEFYHNIIIEMGISEERLYIGNDSEIILEEIEEGICIVAGTGSIVTGINFEGTRWRAGGWGPPLSDKGSGWWMGSKVLEYYIKAWDESVYFNEYCNYLNLCFQIQNRRDAIEKLTDLTTEDVASLAKSIMEFAETGDDFCNWIVNQSIKELSELIKTVYVKLNFLKRKEVPMIEVGSLFKNLNFKTKLEGTLKNELGILNLKYKMLENGPAHYEILLAEKKYKQLFKEEEE